MYEYAILQIYFEECRSVALLWAWNCHNPIGSVALVFVLIGLTIYVVLWFSKLMYSYSLYPDKHSTYVCTLYSTLEMSTGLGGPGQHFKPGCHGRRTVPRLKLLWPCRTGQNLCLFGLHPGRNKSIKEVSKEETVVKFNITVQRIETNNG